MAILVGEFCTMRWLHPKQRYSVALNKRAKFVLLLPMTTQNIAAPTGSGTKLSVADGLRGVAILVVIFHHAFGHVLYKQFPWAVQSGWMGVNLFFILSGFVLMRPYVLRQRSLDTRAHIKTFYLRRIERLYPLFLINAFVAFLFVGRPSWDTFKYFISSITTAGVFIESTFQPRINAPIWSLMVEIWFSILFPAMLWLIHRLGWRKATWICMLLPFGVRIFSMLMLPASKLGQDSFYARLDDFYIGILICKLWYDRPQWIQKIPAWAYMLIGVFAVACASTIFDLKQHHVLTGRQTFFFNHVLQLGFGSMLIAALLGGNALSWLCDRWILRLFGAMCFSLYLWHIPFLWVFGETLPEYIACFSLLLIFSALSYRYIEFGQEKDWRKLFLLS